MDLIYLSENFSLLEARPHSYVFRERMPETYNPNYESTISVAEQHRVANLIRQREQQQKDRTQPCLLCLENKRRKLGKYIRQKSCQDGCLEEEDEDIVGHEQTTTTSQDQQNQETKTKG